MNGWVVCVWMAAWCMYECLFFHYESNIWLMEFFVIYTRTFTFILVSNKTKLLQYISLSLCIIVWCNNFTIYGIYICKISFYYVYIYSSDMSVMSNNCYFVAAVIPFQEVISILSILQHYSGGYTYRRIGVPFRTSRQVTMVAGLCIYYQFHWYLLTACFIKVVVPLQHRVCCVTITTHTVLSQIQYSMDSYSRHITAVNILYTWWILDKLESNK